MTGVEFNIVNGVARLTLARPEKGNAYNQAMLEALAEILQQIGKDAALRVLELSGHGRHFCTGADIGSLTPGSSASGTGIADICALIYDLDVPTLAIVHGGCIGGGLALAASCDVVVATSDAFFSVPELRLGIVPGPLLPVFSNVFELRVLRRLLLTGERFSAEEAQQWGLVDCVAATGDIAAARDRFVMDFMRAAPRAVAHTKQLLRQMERVLPVSMKQKFQHAVAESAASAEALEAKAALHEGRQPGWVPE